MPRRGSGGLGFRVSGLGFRVYFKPYSLIRGYIGLSGKPQKLEARFETALQGASILKPKVLSSVS